MVAPHCTSIRSPVLNATLAPVVEPVLEPELIVQVNVVSPAAPGSVCLRRVNVTVLARLAAEEQYMDVKWPPNERICWTFPSVLPGVLPRPKKLLLFTFWALLPRRIELAPVVPVEPVAPVAPVGPVAPVAPDGPVGPVVPCAPVGPVVPCAPVGPVGPVVPCAPVGPVGPVAPCAPVAPVGPVGP